MLKKTVLAALLSAVAFNASAEAIMLEDFEDATVNYTTSITEFSDGFGDFFTRTDGSNIGSFVSYNNIQGSNYFAAMDLDGEGATLPLTMSFSNIDISNYTNLTFSALFAEDDDGTNQDWDSSDFFTAEYSIDNGAFQNVLAFENDGSAFNTAASLDIDFDGNGDGTELTDTFTAFSSAIAGTGNSLDIRFTFQLNSGDEDIAIDNVLVSGVAAIPEPQTYGMFLAGLGMMGMTARRKLK